MLAENIAYMLAQTSYTLQRLYLPVFKRVEALKNENKPLSDDKVRTVVIFLCVHTCVREREGQGMAGTHQPLRVPVLLHTAGRVGCAIIGPAAAEPGPYQGETSGD